MAEADRECRVRLPVGSCCCALVLMLVAAAPASANDMGGPAAWGLAILWFVIFPVMLPLYVLFVCAIEAAVLSAVLRSRYWSCFKWLLAANVVSTVLGVVWFFVLGEGGWKMALTAGNMRLFCGLIARSFVVTVAEETLVVALIVRQRFAIGQVLKAVAAANAVSCVLTALLLLPLKAR